MSNWFMAGLEDDMRPRMMASAAAGDSFALVTIVAADGGGPRGAGAQMHITRDEAAGFLSGGCIEADVIIHARAALADGRPRRLVYGRGSPFADVRLPCGGRLELLVEAIGPDDAALAALAALTRARRPAVYVTDGTARACFPALAPEAPAAPVEEGQVSRTYLPQQRMVVIGSDPFALAMTELGARIGWATTVVRPLGPEAPPPAPVAYDRRSPGEALAELKPDAWTAVAVATHDLDLDHEALVAALSSDAGYVGVLGSRRRLAERLARLSEAGVSAERLARLKGPIGLDIGSRAPWEIGVAVVAEIIKAGRDGA